METLASSATDSSATHLPPTFHSISQAGVKEFKSTTKTLLRIGTKRKHSGQINKNQRHRKLKGQPKSKSRARETKNKTNTNEKKTP